MKGNSKTLKKWRLLIIDDDRGRSLEFANYVENSLQKTLDKNKVERQGERESCEGNILNYTIVHNIKDAACEIWNTRHNPYVAVLNDMELPLLPGEIGRPIDQQDNLGGIEFSHLKTKLIARIIEEEGLKKNRLITLGGMWIALWANSIDYRSPFLNYSTANAVLELKEMKAFKAMQESDFHLTTYARITNEDFLERVFETLMKYQKFYLHTYANNLWQFASAFWDNKQSLEQYKHELIDAGNDEWKLQNLVPQILLPKFRSKLEKQLFPRITKNDIATTYIEGIWHSLNKLNYDNLSNQDVYVLKAFNALITAHQHVSYKFYEKLRSGLMTLRTDSEKAWKNFVDVAFTAFCSYRNIPAKVFEIGKKIEQAHESDVNLDFKGLLGKEKESFEEIVNKLQQIKVIAEFDQPQTKNSSTYEAGKYIANLCGLEHIIIGTLVGNLYQHPGHNIEKKEIEIGCDFNNEGSRLLIWYLDNSEGFDDVMSFNNKLSQGIMHGNFDKLPGIINFCLVHAANLSLYVKGNKNGIVLKPIIGDAPNCGFEVRRDGRYTYGIIISIPRAEDY